MTQDYMMLALEQAEIAGQLGEIPVGALVVEGRTGKILSACGNRCETLKDPSAHAEILALRQAAQKKGNLRLEGCDLYVTLEPCTMCAGALSLARIRRIYFGAYDPKGGGIEHGAKFFQQPTCHHRPDVIGGVREQACADMLVDFFKQRRLGS